MVNGARRLVLAAVLVQAALILVDICAFTLPASRLSRRPARSRICCRALEDYWKVLGVPAGTEIKEVKRVYRRRAKEEHPDVNKSPGALQRWRKLSEAYGKLIDPEYRRQWSAEEARRTTAAREEARRSSSSPGASSRRPSDARGPSTAGFQGFPKTTETKKWAAAGWDAFQDILRRADSLRQPRAGGRDGAAVREFQASQADLSKAQQKLKQLSSDEAYYLNLTESHRRSGQKKEELRSGLRTQCHVCLTY